ncbi:MAG: tetratricopeptide repeat protein [Clostridiales bacterium]|nr:tetratricopeptide repeat protein [Clostridiales bacterium]
MKKGMAIRMKNKILSILIIITIFSSLTGCTTAGSFKNEGRKLFDQGKYDEAASSFLKAIELNPNRTDYYIDYGMTLIALGRYDEAIPKLDDVYQNRNMVVIKENNKKIHRGKAIAYYYSKEYDKAIEQLNLALEIQESPGLNMDILYYKGDSALKVGNYDIGIDTYTKLIELDNKRAKPLLGRAYCYMALGDFESSLKDYDAAINLEAKSYDGYLGKYALMMEQGMKGEAEELLIIASELGGDTDVDKFNQGLIDYYQGNIDIALIQLEESYGKGFKEAYYYIGEIYREKKDYQKAVYYYETYIQEANVSNSGIYNQLAYSLIKLDDFSNAIKYIEEGLSMGQVGSRRILLKNEIVAYEGMGEFDTALDKMEEYQSFYPGDEEALREKLFLETRNLDN